MHCFAVLEGMDAVRSIAELDKLVGIGLGHARNLRLKTGDGATILSCLQIVNETHSHPMAE